MQHTLRRFDSYNRRLRPYILTKGAIYVRCDVFVSGELRDDPCRSIATLANRFDDGTRYRHRRHHRHERARTASTPRSFNFHFRDSVKNCHVTYCRPREVLDEIGFVQTISGRRRLVLLGADECMRGSRTASRRSRPIGIRRNVVPIRTTNRVAVRCNRRYDFSLRVSRMDTVGDGWDGKRRARQETGPAMCDEIGGVDVLGLPVGSHAMSSAHLPLFVRLLAIKSRKLT